MECQPGPCFTATVNQKAGKAGLVARIFYFSFYNGCLVSFSQTPKIVLGHIWPSGDSFATSTLKKNKFIISYSKEQQQSTKQLKEMDIKCIKPPAHMKKLFL